MEKLDELKNKTIADFGEQWIAYGTNDGFYASQDLFADILGPLVQFSCIQGKRVLDIGSGTGRIVMMLLNAGAAHVTAVEPSAAFDVLKSNISEQGASVISRTSLLKCAGDEIPADLDIDYIFSIGVIHHIPDPDPVVQAAYKALPEGGKFVIWLYGKENSGLYLAIVQPLRKLTKVLPHSILALLVWALYMPLVGYSWLCRWMPLPLKDYLINVLFKMPSDKRRLAIYDQLNPAWAKYYTKEEAESLMNRNGFKKVALYHRRKYSWTVVGEK